MPLPDLLVLSIICLAAIATVLLHKLSATGALAGVLIAGLLWKGTGITGVLMLATFFLAGTIATAIGKEKKQEWGAAEKNKGRRITSQVLANGAIAGLAGLLGWISPQWSTLAQLLAAAALASATADTLSSELGTVYGSRFFNILSFKKDRRGIDGVISVEGTLCGIIGSAMIAGVYMAGYANLTGAVGVFTAGIAGNIADSILGASLQRKGWLSNDGVNWCNTIVAAAVVSLYYYFA